MNNPKFYTEKSELIREIPSHLKTMAGVTFGYLHGKTAVIEVAVTGDDIYLNEVLFGDGNFSAVVNELKNTCRSNKMAISNVDPRLVKQFEAEGMNVFPVEDVKCFQYAVREIKRHNLQITVQSRNTIEAAIHGFPKRYGSILEAIVCVIIAKVLEGGVENQPIDTIAETMKKIYRETQKLLPELKQINENLSRFTVPDLTLKTKEWLKLEIEPERPDFVVINGLKWDRENAVIEGREHFNWHEALGIAHTKGKRLPTKGEWEALVALGSTWDDERKGRWFGKDHKRKADARGSIFLPTVGRRCSNGNMVGDTSTYGGYWGGSVNSSTNDVCNLFFNNGHLLTSSVSWRFGLSVRLVSDL